MNNKYQAIIIETLVYTKHFFPFTLTLTRKMIWWAVYVYFCGLGFPRKGEWLSPTSLSVNLYLICTCAKPVIYSKPVADSVKIIIQGWTQHLVICDRPVVASVNLMIQGWNNILDLICISNYVRILLRTFKSMYGSAKPVIYGRPVADSVNISFKDEHNILDLICISK